MPAHVVEVAARARERLVAADPPMALGRFLAAYQRLRGRRFSREEVEVAWAASLWPACHNARWEALHGDPPVCVEAVAEQAAERLRRAGCA